MGTAPHTHPLAAGHGPLSQIPRLTGRCLPAEKGRCQLSVYPCSVCRQRKPGKLASAYWAWFQPDGGRSAWKMRYCPVCAAEHLTVLLAVSPSTETDSSIFACISCGTDAHEDSDPIYCTLYLPGKEPMEYALQLDGACAAKLRIPITSQGERMPDRGGVVRGPSPSMSAWDTIEHQLSGQLE